MTSPEAAPRLRCADCDYPVRLTHRYPGAKQPARSHPVRIEAEAAAGHTWCEHGIRDDANCSQPHEAAAGTALDPEPGRCPERCYGVLGHEGHHQTVDYDAIRREAAGTALDVERLARALWREAHVCQDWGEHAAKIAAEYARLAAASEPAAGEPK